MTLKKMLVDGEWLETGEMFPLRSPYSGDLLADVATAGEDEIERSLAAAAAAFRKMRGVPRSQLAASLRSIASAIEARKDEFARTICLEAAKPMIYSRGEVERAIATFSWAAGEAERFTGEIVPVDAQAGGRGRFWRLGRGPTCRRHRCGGRGV